MQTWLCFRKISSHAVHGTETHAIILPFPDPNQDEIALLASMWTYEETYPWNKCAPTALQSQIQARIKLLFFAVDSQYKVFIVLRYLRLYLNCSDTRQQVSLLYPFHFGAYM